MNTFDLPSNSNYGDQPIPIRIKKRQAYFKVFMLHVLF